MSASSDRVPERMQSAEAESRRAPFCWFLCFDAEGAPYWFSRENAASLWAVPPKGVLSSAPSASEATEDCWEELECPHTRLHYRFNHETNRCYWLVGALAAAAVAEEAERQRQQQKSTSRELFFACSPPGGGFNWSTISGNRQPLSRQFLCAEDELAIPAGAVAIEGPLEKLGEAGSSRFGTRYFVLRGRVLSFYKNESKSALKRDLPPKKNTSVDLALYTVRHKADSLLFELHPFVESNVAWTLRARNPGVKSRWFDVFRALHVDVEEDHSTVR